MKILHIVPLKLRVQQCESAAQKLNCSKVCVFLFLTRLCAGREVPGRSERLSGLDSEEHHRSKQAGNLRDGASVSHQKTDPAPRYKCTQTRASLPKQLLLHACLQAECAVVYQIERLLSGTWRRRACTRDTSSSNSSWRTSTSCRDTSSSRNTRRSGRSFILNHSPLRCWEICEQHADNTDIKHCVQAWIARVKLNLLMNIQFFYF